MTEEPDNPHALDLDADQQEVQHERLLEALDRTGEVQQLAGLLQTEGVRDLMWRVLARCGIYGTTYSKNFGDMAFAEGRRSVGLWLLSEICEADPQAEMLMRQKANRLAHDEGLRKSRRRRPRQP